MLPCEVCKGNHKHTKFTCPKLHYIPLEQIVIHKSNYKEKRLRNKRIEIDYREERQLPNALVNQKELIEELKEGVKYKNHKGF